MEHGPTVSLSITMQSPEGPSGIDVSTLKQLLSQTALAHPYLVATIISRSYAGLLIASVP